MYENMINEYLPGLDPVDAALIRNAQEAFAIAVESERRAKENLKKARMDLDNAEEAYSYALTDLEDASEKADWKAYELERAKEAVSLKSLQ